MAMMELLVATFSSLLKVTIDSESLLLSGLETIHTGEGSYYGISWDNEHYYVIARDYPEYVRKNKVLVFDKQFQLKRTLTAGESLREAHQLCMIDGKLVICNTNNNSLTVLNPADDTVEHIYPLPATQNANFHHINSIFYKDGRIWLTAANRYRNSFFMCFDYPSMQLQDMDAVGLSAHNIVEWKDCRISCDSYHGSLVFFRKGAEKITQEELPMHSVYLVPDLNEVEVLKLSMKTSFFREQRGAPVFPRGLAMTDDMAIVGLSEITRRSMRNDSMSSLMVLKGLDNMLADSKDYQVQHIELGAYGAVMEVRLISEPDYGHP